MKTLAELLTEAERQEDALTNPRLFLAFFPGGTHNGRFLDPYLGVMEIIGITGVVYAGDFNMHSISAIWVE